MILRATIYIYASRIFAPNSSSSGSCSLTCMPV